uniref:Auxin-responsive protein n=1 Tax=Paeonia lactiflora TaxID=35924 RepID=A0A977TNY7_PAELC|nr:ARF protein [Paeonia lactiflora]
MPHQIHHGIQRGFLPGILNTWCQPTGSILLFFLEHLNQRDHVYLSHPYLGFLSCPGMAFIRVQWSVHLKCCHRNKIMLLKDTQGSCKVKKWGAKGSHESGPFKPPMSQYLVPPNPDLGHSQMGLENQPQFPIHEPYHPYSGSTMSIPVTSGNSNFWPPILTSQGAHDNVGVSGMGKFMLFGVNLAPSSAEFPSIQAATSIELQTGACTVPPTSRSSSETIHVSHPSKSTAVFLSEKQCKNLCLNANRSCTKVIKYGCALGRSVDLSRLNGYDELIRELDQMFGFEGRLIDKSSGWNVTYLDVEGDLMLVGDYPWQEFRSMVKMLFFYPKERVNDLNPRSPENLTLA